MTIRPILITLAFAGTLAAQTFLQMSDPQFGMFSKNENFAHETVNFDFAIATANRLKPAFVVITGDLINESTNSAQAAEYKRICAKLDSKIPLYSIPGNHDVGNEPTAETLARYRERNGPDYYTFRSGEMAGIVLNSNLEKGTKNVPQEAAKMEAWFKAELGNAKGAGAKNIIVFQHIPLFQKEPNEAEVYNNIPVDVRQRYLKMMHDAGVKWVFAGHLHYNLEARDGDLQEVATGPVGMPLGKGKSGIRVVAVTPQGVKQQYFEFGEIPETLELK
jgi:serine/threonine-protein phosphatase CPPED1